MKKTILKPAIIIASVAIIMMGAAVLYAYYSPIIYTSVSYPAKADTLFYTEDVDIGIYTRLGSATSKKLDNALSDYAEQQEDYYSDLNDFTAPTHITAQTSFEGGVLTIIFSGPATRQDTGETIEYYMEITEDFGSFTNFKAKN